MKKDIPTSSREYYRLIERDGAFRAGLASLCAPRQITWHITYRCNLDCLHCGVASMNRSCTYTERDELTFREVCRIIDEGAASGVKSLYFTGGEPFMRSDMLDILRYSRQKGMKTGMVSNGTLITGKVARDLMRLEIGEIMVSLDGASPATYDVLRQRKGAFRKALRGLENLVEAKKVSGSGTIVCTNTVLVKDTLEELPAIAALSCRTGADEVRVQPYIPGTEHDGRLIFRERGHVRRILREFEKAVAPPAFCDPDMVAQAAHLLARGERFAPRCMAPSLSSFVTPPGEVYPCCFLCELGEFLMGSLKRDSLEAIWGKRLYSKLREDMLECLSFSRCRACAALPELAGRDLLEEALREQALPSPAI
ncbi:MAG: radical SAM protein [Candidatus Eremiobacteraeota bacterium]|nr:radical SAM protein [Candidatus Eremiobacteraeota bacterium]